MQHTISSILLLCCVATSALAHEPDFQQDIELQASKSHGHTPLWLNANKYGLSSLSQSNGYLRWDGQYNQMLGVCQWSTEADLVLPIGYRYSAPQERHYTSHFIIQQAYTALQYKHGILTIGAKQHSMELRDNELSSGSQCFGINARPIPQVRLALADYWDIPGFNHWISIKGHLAFGVMTDGEWEAATASSSNKKYNRLTRHHEKAGYLRIGKEERLPLYLTLSLEMSAQWGGTLYNWTGMDQNNYTYAHKTELESNISSYWHALSGTGAGDVGENTYKNTEGNQLGAWGVRIDWDQPTYAIGLYADHFFEDHSGLFLLDYDGYGTGANWDNKQDRRFFLYKLADMLVGTEIKLKQCHWLNKFTIEYMNTRYQSGPIYHDHNMGLPDHLGGADDDYNHSSLPGWQHWGQVMGNPFFLSPVYNMDGSLSCQSNRQMAWHLGLKGDIIEHWSYRMLLSHEKGWGTYYSPFVIPKKSTNAMFELTTQKQVFGNCIEATIAYGQDWGQLRGNNQGAQITIRYKLK